LQQSPAARSPAPDRAPLTARVREPGTPADYVINLQSTREPVAPGVIESISVASSQRLYVSQTQVGGDTWYRLRLGFFASEQEARAALAGLPAQFPRAWVGRAEADEVRLASDYQLERGAIVGRNAPPQDEPQDLAAPEVAVAGAGALGEERLQALLAEGREAMLSDDIESAIRIYTRLLQQPGTHRAQAREYLGVAREKNGQLAHAQAEYRQYLEEYPQSEGAERVRQRLNGLVMAAEAPREPLRRGRVEEQTRWDVSTGVSQYYRRDVNQFDQDQPEIVSLSALFSDIDLSVRRGGTNLDLLGRVAISHLYDLMGEDERGPGNRNRISYAYVDLSGAQREWSLRVGRQSLHGGGVLGRFDGAHFAYDWAEDRRVHFTTGYPVESTRDSLETERRFVGAAVDFDHLFGEWDLSAFVNQQTIEGIADRQAVGVELRYLDEQRSLTSMLDYDLDYSELNTALVLGTWRLPNRMTLSALVDVRMSPVLTTRNALIGQPVRTIEELLLVWNEDEIRQLALDRTAGSRTTTLGIAKPIAERFQINADITVAEIDATFSSAGVAAMPGTGTQTYYSTSLVGSGLFGTGDVTIVNLRYGRSEEFKISQLTWDARFPIGRRMRINPRLRFAVWEGLLSGRRRETITPSFRFLLNTRNHYRLEFELGSDQFTRTDLQGEQDSSGHFINLGYRADF
ncbi:MAG TPA: SPOR domain-containing protein, partial [Gammaproteobacteria bacterium]|nr:SPOR domain-containing protein [Gammaproteobacteria bacterium]